MLNWKVKKHKDRDDILLVQMALYQKSNRFFFQKIGQKPTDELNKLLENMKPGELDEYLEENQEENQEYIAGTDRSFYEYMKTTICSKGIKLKDVYQSA